MLGASLFLAIAVPAIAGAQETPEDFIRRVYARYRNDGPGVVMERPGGAPFYSAALLDAFAKDRAGDVGSIDWDPVCNCQDWQNLRLKSIAVTAAKQVDRVMARVVLANLGSTRTITLTLAKTPDGWRIDDIGEKGAESIVGLLRKAAKP